MIQINHQQILNRYDILPGNLKEAGFSPFNTKIIYQIGSEQHLIDDKITKISELVGYVIFGFIHPEDLAKEIRNALNLNPEIANAIAREIDRKIFSAIRADLEKVYSPADLSVEAPSGAEAEALAKEGAPSVLETERPIVSEIKKPEIGPAFSSLPVGQVGVPTVEPPIRIIEEEPKTGVPTETSKTITLPAEGPLMIHEEVKFKPLSETKKSLGGLFEFLKKKGGEKEKEAGPVKAQVEMGKQAGIGRIEKVEDKEKKVGLIEIRPPESLPIKIKIEPAITIQELQPPKEEPLKTKKSIIGLLGFLRKKEGEKEKEMSPAKTPAETGKQAEIGEREKKTMAIVEKETTPTPAPKIIIEKLEPKSVPEIKQPLGGFLLKFLTRKKEVAKEMKPLSSEVKVIPPEPPAVSRAEPPKVRVVHYTELRTPITPVEIKPPENLPKEVKPLGMEIQPTKIEQKILAKPLDVCVAPSKKEESKEKKESEEEIIDLSAFK